MIIEVDCETCAGTGNMTPGGGRNNLKDRCTTCGGKGKMPARTGETAASSWPLAVPGAAAQGGPVDGDRATVLILYTNWQGETRPRRIRLDFNAHGNEVLGLGFGSNEWHPQPQLLLNAFDIEKDAYRTFAMAGVKAWGEKAVRAEVERMNRATATPSGIVARMERERRHCLERAQGETEEGEVSPAHYAGRALAYRDAIRLIQECGTPVQPGPDFPAAWRDVLAERCRQVEAEGWTPEHDDEHNGGQMALAAATYAVAATWDEEDREPFRRGLFGSMFIRNLWPWAKEWWKPSTRRRDLVKAGALTLAEIERLDRAATRESSSDERKEEPTICVCGEPIRDGDQVYTCESSGIVHAECMGTDPENFPGPDGEPHKPGDPIPAPWVYSTREATR